MNRREFLKTLMGGAICAAIPSSALSALESIGSAPLSSYENFLTVEYSWLGLGRLKISHCSNKPAAIEVLDKDKVINRFISIDGNCLETPLQGISGLGNISLRIAPEGMEPKTVTLSDYVKGGYQPGRSMMFMIDLNQLAATNII